MKIDTNVKYLALASVYLFFLMAMPASAQRVVRIGVVLDGPWERNDEWRETFEQEITSLLRSEFSPAFPEDKRLQADFTASGIAEAIDRLLADPEVDIILTLGPQASTEICHRTNLSKPVVAPFVIDPEMQGIPRREGTSGTPNLSYVDLGTKVPREIEVFRELYPFDHLAVLSTQAIQERIPQLQQNLLEETRHLGIQITFVPVGNSAAEVLENIPADADAVYITPLLQLGRGEFDRLVAGLIKKELPSFSMFGRSEVERGILAALALDLDYQRVARRVALNIQRILLGEEAATLPVAFARRERLTINMTTARAIGIYPSWYLITEAELLEEQRVGLARQISLASTVREAVSANLDLVSARRVVSSGLERIRQARANRYPQLGISGSSVVIDGDRAEGSFGSAARWTLAGSVGVSQLVYSEPVWANIDIENQLQVSREEQLSELRLDIILVAAGSYLNVLRAKTAERIQKNNLEVTRSNLELARSRVALGASSPGEVFRWEIQIANNRRDVIEFTARRNQAEISLNRILNRPLEEPFETEEAALDDRELATSFQRLQPYVDNMLSFRTFRNFMVGEAIQASPELRQLDAATAAQERNLLAAQRAFYVPEVAAQADLTGYARAGAGSSSSLPELIPGLSFPTPGNIDWNIAVSASLPLFDGGFRRSAVRQAEEDLAKLRIDRQSLLQRIEQRIRIELHAAGSSFAGIRLANDAARASRSNLGLVTDAYSQGTADILTLLDAQNQALVAELQAANAVYNFLVDLMNVQRGVGRFDFFLNPAEQQDFMERLDRYFQKEGYRSRKP